MKLADLIAKIKAENGGSLPPGVTEDVLRAMLRTETDAEINAQTDGLGIAGLRTNRDTILTEKKSAEDELRSYRALGKPEELQRLRTEKEKEDGTHYEQERTRLETAHKTKEAEWEEKEKGYLATINYLAIDQEVMLGLAEGGCAKELLRAGLLHWRDENRTKKLFAVEGSGEDAKGVVKTDMGKRPIRDFVREWMEADTGRAFRAARDNGGGGSKGDGDPEGKGHEVNPWLPATKNATMQGQIWKNDRPKAERMMAEAGVKIPGK